MTTDVIARPKRSTNTVPRAPDPTSPAPYHAAEVAYLLGVCYRTVWAWKGSKRLPKPIQPGKSPMWPRKAFDKWLTDGCPKGAR